ncbi:MAG: DNA polymerase domain-containing protein [Nanoarchaeota archaeon]
MECILVDSYVDAGRIVLWIWDGKKMLRLLDSFEPKAYAVCDEQLIGLLSREHVPFRFVVRRDFISQKDVRVVEMSPGIRRFRRLVRLIEEWGEYRYALYNADIPLEQMYFFEKDVFPLCKISVEPEERSDGMWIKSIRNTDTASHDYEIPLLKTLSLAVTFLDDTRKGFNIPVECIRLDKQKFIGREEDVLRGFADVYAKEDPDILIVDDGDNVLPHLAHRLFLYGILFDFGREPDMFEKRDGKNYFSYGRVLFKKHPIFLKGRLHIDASSFLFREGGIEGVFELARTCAVPVQRMARQSPGSGISNLQVKYAYPDYLIPYKKNQVERYKTAFELLRVDKGGIIFEPRVGFHQDIAELDFVSMYPSIMVKHNISPETLFCDCCPKNTPEAEVHTCQKRKGLIPKILEPIIARRKWYKKNKNEGNSCRANALKCILVTCFGYMGFKHAKFGRIEAHEAINAHSRATLLRAVRVAEEHGFEVIHGIVDSMWVKKKGATEKELKRLTEMVGEATGLEIAIEGRYRWIVFLQSVQHTDLPVPSRFYGVFQNGSFKLRGIDVRRRDSPKMIKDLQEAQLRTLKRARSRTDFDERMKQCITLLKQAIKNMQGQEKEDFLIKKHISKVNYKASCAQKVMYEKYLEEGLVLHPGESVQYVIRDVKARIPAGRFSADTKKIDFEAYRNLLIRATANLFLPFGLSKERLEKLTRNEQQLSLIDCFLAWTDSWNSVRTPMLSAVQRRVEDWY